VAATVLLRLVLILYLRTWLGDAGAYEHEIIARSLVAGEGFRFFFFSNEAVPSSHQAPAIPYLLAGAYRVFGVGSPWGRLAVECLAAGMGGLAAAALGLLAHRWWGRWTMTLAMVAFMLYPAFIYMPTRIQAVNWSITFLLLFVLGFVRLHERPRSLGWAGVTGLAGGMGILGEPILLAPFGACWLWLAWRAGFPGAEGGRPASTRPSAFRRLGVPAVVFGVAAAVMTPWLVRNIAVHGRFTLVKSSFGYVFWQGNHHGASGTDKLRVSEEVRGRLAWRLGSGLETEALLDRAREEAVSVDTHLTQAEVDQLSSYSTEAEKMDWFSHRIREEVVSDPAHYIRMCVRRLGMLLWFDDTNPRSFVLAYRLPYLVLALLALAGLALVFRSRPPPAGFVFWIIPLASLFLVHTLIITSARFRLSMEVLYILPAALAVSRVSQLALFPFLKR
jgi:hypothetical protein